MNDMIDMSVLSTNFAWALSEIAVSARVLADASAASTAVIQSVMILCLSALESDV